MQHGNPSRRSSGAVLRALSGVLVAVVVSLVAAACITSPTTSPATPGTGSGTRLPPGAPDPYQVAGLGEFAARCSVSHRATADPIVAPGNAAFWHQHDFFGATSTDQDSTVDSLLASGSSCNPAVDRSGYWVPTLLENGVVVDPTRITVYYQVKRPQDPTKVRPFPVGLRMIAGSAMATSAQPDHVAQWHCMGASGALPTIPDCGSGNSELILQFPDCWDGVSLDSSDHKQHMAYSRGQDCPVTHPVLVPELSFRIEYPASGPGVVLSSDAASHAGHVAAAGHEMAGGLTAHGDFINAWAPGELERRVTTCLHAARKCDAEGRVLGA